MLPDYSDLTIISPTLNEEKNILELIEALTSNFPDAEILIVDDGSRDRTAHLVLEAGKYNPRISFLDRRNSAVKGLSVSVMDGIEQARTKYFLVIDADLQHPPAIARQLYELAKTGVLFVAGARAPYQENQGWHRIVITKIATQLAKLYLKLFKNLNVRDPMSGFFLSETNYCRQLIQKNRQRFEMRGYKIFFDLLKCAPVGVTYAEVQYQFNFRTHGKSKLSPRHALYFLRGLIR